MELTNEKKAEIANKLNFRQNLSKIEDAICKHPSSITGDDFEAKNPTKSTFVGGCYIREIFMPADQIITTKIHKKDHPFFVLSGKIIVISEKGKQEITGPYHGITRAGTKRLISVIEDCVFITVHATDKLTIEEVTKEVIAEDFDDPLVALK
jgi:hypothetical protein